MLLIFLVSALLNPPQAPLTLGSLAGLSPEALGDRVLAGRDHGIIETVGGPNHAGMMPEGFVELDLTERASRKSSGCVRRRWKARFLYQPGNPEGSATLFDPPSSVNEVALLSPSCADGGFVHVNPKLSAEDALAALRHLHDVRKGGSRVEISCTDSTRSNLCATPESIRQALAQLRPWAVTKADGATEFWLGERGGTVTAVRFSETQRDLLTIRRFIPAPF
jgi:hypothetical protein